MAYFLMQCFHHPDQQAGRDAARPSHREWVQSGGDGLASVLVGSALLGDDGQPVGHFGIMEARTADDVLQFAEQDPFALQGVVSQIKITSLPVTFQAHRIADRMTIS